MTTAAQAVEIALQGVVLTEREADRLRTLIAARVRPATARERLDEHVDALRRELPRDLGGAQYLHDLRRLIREALAEQAARAVGAANDAQLSGSDAYETALAVQQALLTDEGDR